MDLETFKKLVEENLFIVESHKINKNGTHDLQIFGIEALYKQLMLGVVVGRSEQSICTSCKEDIADEFIPRCYCPECGNEWGK